MYIPQKGQTNAQKQPKIANNCKISEITKYGDKITKMDKNEPKTAKMHIHQKGKKMPKNG